MSLQLSNVNFYRFRFPEKCKIQRKDSNLLFLRKIIVLWENKLQSCSIFDQEFT